MHTTQEKLLKLLEQENLGGLTLREIGAKIGEPHPQKVKHHIGMLSKKGLLTPLKDSGFIKESSGVTKSGLVNIPIAESAEFKPVAYLKVSKSLLSEKALADLSHLVAVKAEGNYMNRSDIDGKNIEEGDYILVRTGVGSIKSGEVILSATQGFGTVRKFVKDALGQKILITESTTDYPPIYLGDELYHLVAGKVVQVLKKPHLQKKGPNT